VADRRRFGVEGRKGICAKDKELRAEIIWWHHDVPAAGHGGR